MKYFIVFILGLFTTFFFLSKHSYVLDESFGVYISRDWTTLTHILWTREANMWLYYLLLHFWLILGNGEFIVRSFSTLFALLTLPVVYKLTRHFFGSRTALTSGLLMVVNLFFVFYAQQARGYSLALFLICLSCYSYLRFNDSRKFKILYLFSSSLALYTHFYTSLVLLAQWVILLLQKKWRGYIFYVITIGVLCLPIFFSPSFHYSRQLDWLSGPTLTNLWGTLFVLGGDFPPLFVIYGVLLVYFLIVIFRKYHSGIYLFLLAWLILPIIFAMVISLTIRPIYQSVYFIISLPPFCILSALSINQIKSHITRRLVLLLILIFSFTRLILWYTQNTGYKWVISNNPEDWKNAVVYVNSNTKPSDKIIFFGYFGELPFEQYKSVNSPESINISSADYNPSGSVALPHPNTDLISAFNYPRVWLVINRASGSYFDRQKYKEEILFSLDKSYIRSQTTEFPGIQVVLFVKRPFYAG